MSLLNNLSLEELEMLLGDVTAMREAGIVLLECGVTPTFDLTPGAAMRITTPAVMPAVEDGVTLTPLAADIVRRTSTRDLTHCDPELSAQLAKEREEFTAMMGLGNSRPEHVEIPSFQKRESTEAPPTSPASEPVDPPPALGEVVGGGTDSAEPSRPAEADAVPQDATETGAEAESGGGVEVAAPEAAAATDADAKPANWTATEDAVLIQLIVQGIMDKGMSRKAAIIAAARSIGRPEPGTLWRVAKILKGKLDDALTAAAFEQAKTEAPEIPPADPVVASVSREPAAGGHSPAAALEIDAAALDQAFDRKVDAMPDLHGEDLRVWQWVAAHRAKWPHTAGTDLDLAVGLGRGEKLNLIALDLGIDVRALQARWEVLSRPIQNAQGKITLDGMPRLIKILRLIAKAPAAAA